MQGCSLGKHTIESFHISETRSKEILDLIYSNVCGPMFDKSLVGLIYYVTFINDILGRHVSTYSKLNMKYSISSRSSGLKWKP